MPSRVSPRHHGQSVAVTAILPGSFFGSSARSCEAAAVAGMAGRKSRRFISSSRRRGRINRRFCRYTQIGRGNNSHANAQKPQKKTTAEKGCQLIASVFFLCLLCFFVAIHSSVLKSAFICG